MTIKSYKTYLPYRERGEELNLLLTLENFMTSLEKYELNFRKYCPIMGLDRYIELNNKYISSSEMIGRYRIDLYEIDLQDGKPKRAGVLFRDEEGKKFGRTILLDLTIEQFKQLLPKYEFSFKYYNKLVTIKTTFKQARDEATCIISKGDKILLERKYILPTRVLYSNEKELRYEFLQYVRKAKKSKLNQVLKPRKTLQYC